MNKEVNHKVEAVKKIVAFFIVAIAMGFFASTVLMDKMQF